MIAKAYMRAFARQDGMLTDKDLEDLASQRARIANLMLDGRWHSSIEILETAGGTEGLRRLRELRECKGWTVEKVRRSESRVWEYRLVIAEV